MIRYGKMRLSRKTRDAVLRIATSHNMLTKRPVNTLGAFAFIYPDSIRLTDHRFDFTSSPFEEIDADLFIRTNGHCYQDGDVVTLGQSVSPKFRGLTGRLSEVGEESAILDYKGGSTVIRLNWIDRGYEEPTLVPIPEDILEYARSLPDEELEGVEATLNERGQRYGDFDKHAQITQDLKAVMANTPNWQTLTPSAKEALEMIAHKIGRILNGDPTYSDSWHDIAGYATLVEKECDHE